MIFCEVLIRYVQGRNQLGARKGRPPPSKKLAVGPQ